MTDDEMRELDSSLRMLGFVMVVLLLAIGAAVTWMIAAVWRFAA